MKETGLRYCGQCQKSFQNGQKVWFAWLENRCFCFDCKVRLNIKDWEPRKVVM